ncbi:MAG: nucleotidyl transferase AbiEii/AbiGii toxin family protein [archaeon]|nr:nucleotidyl transferase AbiEii/AbiGii toxin family protein [archaeon]
MDLPLNNQLKKRSQIELAQLQDEVIDIIYSINQKAVLHGGTAIWRCYDGSRFSEDLDFYVKLTSDFEEKLAKETTKRGFSITKLRKTDNTIFAKITNGKTVVSIELVLREKKGTVVFYNNADGTSLNILSLTKEELLLEKAIAFKNRKLIRDIYDVYFLMQTTPIENIKPELREITEKFENPADEKNLKALIYKGVTPTFRQMIEAIKRRIQK